MTSAGDVDRPSQTAVTERLVDLTPPDGIIVSNLGVSSWILSAVADRDRNFYMKGGMGLTTPMGLGMALGTSDPVTVVDGDGSMVMSLGALSTVGEQRPDNLVIVVMNNGGFATTGGQPSVASGVAFEEVARGCGLEADHVTTVSAFEAAYRTARSDPGPHLIDCPVTTTVPDEYPEPDYAHSFLKQRFRTAVTEE